MDRYDRQLKIWGQLGQFKLNEAKIGILSAHTPFLQELLKNLVLMGVSNFNWYDLSTTERDPQQDIYDVSVNHKQPLFYVDNLQDSLNTLHPNEVHLNNCSTLTDLINKSNTIVTFNINKQDPFKNIPNTRNIPIYTVFHRGFCGYIKLKLNEPHFIVNPHNEYTISDLRLDNPWTELKQLMDTAFCLPNHTNSTDNTDVFRWSQLPYAVILYKLLHETDAKISNVKQLKENLDSIYINQWNPDGIYDLNYTEAKRFAHLAFSKHKYDSFINKLHDELLSIPIEGKDNDDTYRPLMDQYNNDINKLLHMLKNFCQDDANRLPLQGQLPDMESSTDNYNKLCETFNNYQKNYLNSFQKFVAEIGEKNERLQVENLELIPFFIKNLRHLVIMRSDNVTNTYTDSNSSLYSELLMLQQCPTAKIEDSTFKTQLNATQTYSTIAYLAALTAQETMKIITHQFIPNKLFVYDSLNANNIQSI